MKGLTTIVVLAAWAWSAGALAQAPAGDANRGRERVQMCQGCHGIEGFRTAFPEVYHVPRIAGQHAQYLVAALQAYKSGARNHPSMKAIAATLSDQEIADLAAYYAQPDEKMAGGKR
jgi:cytochrome c553